MLKTRLAVAAAAMCFGTISAEAQAMSNKTIDNPTTQGYATSGAAAKDQHSTGPKVTAKKKSHRNQTAANAMAPVGITPAETAGASSPAGSPAMKKDDGRLNPH